MTRSGRPGDRVRAGRLSWSHLGRQVDPRFRRRARRYFAQCALAGLALFVILAFERGLAGAAIVASVASSIFIVFVVPRSVAAGTRRVLGFALHGRLENLL